MSGHKALGRGLNALFNSTSTTVPKDNKPVAQAPVPESVKRGAEVGEIAINNIRPNRHQPRTEFRSEALEELAASIRTHGIAQPLIITKTPDAGQFELIAGERRLRAAKMAGLNTVPCIIKKVSNQQRFEVALIENLQREDLNALDEAIAIDSLMKEYGLKQEEVAAAVGKSRSAVANTLRFLRLHEDVQKALREGRISEGHAKCLAGLAEHSAQLRFLDRIFNEKMTVRDLEYALAPVTPSKKKKGAKPSKEDISEVRKYEEDIQRQLGRRVEIQTNGKKGWIRFAFYSPWDLEVLLKKLDLLEGSPDDTLEQAPEEGQS